MSSYCGDMENLKETFPAEALTRLRRHNLLRALLEAEVTEAAIREAAVDDNERRVAWGRWQGDRSEEEAYAIAEKSLGWGRNDLEWQLMRPLRLQKTARERFALKAETRFLQRKDQLDLVTYSLVRSQDSALARELYLRLASSEARFADLAPQYSEGPERYSQGQIGPKPISQAHPILAERLRCAKDGELIEPFSIEGWWLIVRREQLLNAQFDEAMRDRMSLELLSEWIQAEVTEQLQRLNTEA